MAPVLLQPSVSVVCNQYDLIHPVTYLVLSYPTFFPEYFNKLIDFYFFKYKMFLVGFWSGLLFLPPFNAPLFFFMLGLELR